MVAGWKMAVGRVGWGADTKPACRKELLSRFLRTIGIVASLATREVGSSERKFSLCSNCTNTGSTEGGRECRRWGRDCRRWTNVGCGTHESRDGWKARILVKS